MEDVMSTQRTLLVAVAIAVLVAIYILLSPGNFEGPKSVTPDASKTEAPAGDAKPAKPANP